VFVDSWEFEGTPSHGNKTGWAIREQEEKSSPDCSLLMQNEEGYRKTSIPQKKAGTKGGKGSDTAKKLTRQRKEKTPGKLCWPLQQKEEQNRFGVGDGWLIDEISKPHDKLEMNDAIRGRKKKRM